MKKKSLFPQVTNDLPTIPAVTPVERTGRVLLSPPTLPVGAASAGVVTSPGEIDVEVVLGFDRQLSCYSDLVLRW